ncbi:restriction endonuclease subunit S [Coleofasciculus sp. E1-EBD-02]|uniref:restriction endonuclease subunit S n=1 Tax=Coleofasciculus sp. E1-EBD-02 TaxID=3068481 RepID=UPI0032FA69DD
MSDWQDYSLAEFTDIRVSNVDKKTKPNEEQIRLCNYMDVYVNDYITADLDFMESTASPPEYERFKVDKGDVVITKDSETPYDIGIPSVVVDEIENLVCGYHLALIKPNPKIVNSVFLSKQLSASSVASYFSRVAAGSTRYGLSNGAIARTKVSLPPLVKQDKIAKILQTVDRAIAHTEALIEKYQQIKAGLMHDLFTRGIGADGKLRPPRDEAPELYQESAIGWIPKDWNWEIVADLCSQVVDCPHSTPIYRDSGIPCIRTADMEPGELILEQAYCVDEKDYKIRTQRLVPKEGDIIYSREGERLGIASPVGIKKVCLGQRVMLLRPDSNTDPSFLLWSMNHIDFYRRVVRGLGATTSPHVNVGDIKAIPISVPTYREQVLIGEKINAVQGVLNREKKFRAKLQQKKNGLMHDLLTGKVPVKVHSDKVDHI